MRNEAQRCIYATWPSTDMTFATQRNCFNFWAVDWTQAPLKKQRELLPIQEPLFSKSRIFHALRMPQNSDASLNTFPCCKYSKSNLGVLWGPAFFGIWPFIALQTPCRARLLLHFPYHTRTPKKRRIRLIFATKKCVLDFDTVTLQKWWIFKRLLDKEWHVCLQA